MKADELITRAKIQIQRKQPFFAYLLLHLKCINDAEGKVLHYPTCAVDNNANMYYHPDFIEGLAGNSRVTDKIEAVLCHEIMHKALFHLDRIKTKEMLIWNIATDIAINDMLSTSGFNMNIEGILLPENHSITIPFIDIRVTIDDINKKSAEVIYDELLSKLKGKMKQVTVAICGNGDGKSKSGKGQGKSFGFDEHIFGQKPTDSEQRKDERDWQKRLVEATTYAKQRGNLPAGMERIVGDILEQKVNWKQLLYRYITNTIPHDYTYSYPSKKSQATGFYMPSIKKEEIDVVVAIDTSGSIGQKELNDFMGEIVAIAKSFNNLKMTAIICDCEVKDVIEVTNGGVARLLETKIKGGGGTSHIPVYDWVAENKPTARLIVNFTDGFTTFPPVTPLQNTIWVISGGDGKNIPFGEVIKVED